MSLSSIKGRYKATGSGAAMSAAGCQQASFNVDASGQAVYSIPIDTPPGIAGLQPQLALNYSSRTPNGILGVGWSLSGMSSITRMKATYATDGFNSGISYDATDRYALDGQRLINVRGDYHAPGAVYYTEIQSWNFVRAGDTEAEGFVVTRKNGQIARYGATPDSRIRVFGGSQIRAWALSSLEDLNGNRIEFRYTAIPVSGAEDTGAYYLDTIGYSIREGLPPGRFVQCTYENRPDPLVTHIGGYPVRTTYRMRSVITSLMAGGSEREVIRTYTLGYRTSTATQLSCIESITESGAASGGSPSLPSTRIAWQDIDHPAFTIQPASQLDQHARSLGLIPMDVNGDGRTDLVQLWENDDNSLHATVYLATTDKDTVKYIRTSDTRLGSFPATRQVLPMDLSGDGRTDLLIAYQSGTGHVLKLAAFVSTGQGFAEGETFDTGDVWDAANHIAFYPMDVNGDGRTDLVELYRHQDPNRGKLLYFRSYLSKSGDGSGQLFTPAIVSPTNDPGDTSNLLAIWPLDVNGDGMMDIVRVWRRGADAHVIASVYLSVSKGVDDVAFAAKVDSDLGTLSQQDQIGFFPADVNGDGMMDLLQIWQEPAGNGTRLHLTTFLCDGAGGFVAGTDSIFSNQHIDRNGFFPMGFHGGGQTDIVNKWISGAGKLMFSVFASSPSGAFRFVTDFDAGMAGTAVTNASFFAGDTNGDGKADLIRVSAGMDHQPVIVPYTATGPYPDLVASITNPLGGSVAVRYAPLTDPLVYGVDVMQAFPNVAGRRYPNPLTPAQFPVQSVLGQALYVVSGYRQTNDAAVNRFAYSIGYSLFYANAQVDLLGRGWQGFQRLEKLCLDTGLRTTTTYHQAYPYTGNSSGTRLEADGTWSGDPRVPKKETALLMSQSSYSYFSFVRGKGATDDRQQVIEVLKTASQTDQFDYGEEHYDYSIGLHFDYDDYGNLAKNSYWGYVDRSTGQPLYPSEIVYRYNLFSNQIGTDGWALGYALYAKVTSNAADADISRFLPGDLQLQRLRYEPGTWHLQTSGQWDDSNGCYLTTSYVYDEFGNKVSETKPGGFVTSYTYESDYHTFRETTVLPPNEQGIRLSAAYGYDPRYGREVARSDANGFVFITALDAFGRETASQGPLPDVNGVQSDPNQLTPLVTGSAKWKDVFLSAVVVTTARAAYLFDGKGGHYTENATLQSFPTDDNREFLWKQRFADGLNRERLTVQHSGQAAGDILVLTDYTASNQVATQSIPFFSNDPIAPQAGAFIRYAYDVIDRKLSQQQPAGSDGNQRNLTTWYYGSRGVVTQTEAAGTDAAYIQEITHHFYDSQQQAIRSVVKGDGDATTSFTYDRLSRNLSVTDPATTSNPQGVTNALGYDSLGRRLTLDNPDQNTTGDPGVKAMTFAYDASTGFLSSQVNAAGEEIAYSYDQQGRVIRTSFSDGRVFVYRYDDAATNGNGRTAWVSVTAADGSQELRQQFGYDRYGNNIVVQMNIRDENDVFVTANVFDPQQRIVRQTLPDQRVMTRSFDSGMLVSQSLGDARVDYPLEKYTALGQFAQAVYGTQGVVNDFVYNPVGLLYGESVRNPGGPLLELSYSYDSLSELLTIVDELNRSQSQQFAYRNKRLVTASVPGFDGGSYDYDASGNILSKDGGVYTYHAHFPLTIKTGDNIFYTATQDACGNTRSRTTSGRTLDFSYTTRGDLVHVRSGSQTLLTVLTDHLGRRVREEKADGTVNLYINSSFQVERKKVASGVQTTVTAYLRDSRGAVAMVRIRPGETRQDTLYLRRDHKGNITMTFRADGTIGSRIGYDAYGLPKLLGGPDDIGPKYEQRDWNPEIGLYYFGARFYDPMTARFLTPDSSPGSSSYLQADVMNRFAFELNNPLNHIDPSGHMASWMQGLLTGLGILAAGLIVVASAGTLAPAVVGAAAAIGATVSTAAATTFITILGSAAIAAGISATAYSATHKDDFSWKDYEIQAGISGVVGGITAGVLVGLSSAVFSATSVLTAGLVTAVGDTAGQFFTNLAEGANLSDGLLISAATGFVFGAAGAAIGEGTDRLVKNLAQRWVNRQAGAVAREARAATTSEWSNLLNKGDNLERYESLSFPAHAEERAEVEMVHRLNRLLERPIVRVTQLLISNATEFPEFYIESNDWGWTM
ncbi:MAG TPA: FG-GAP-like repeat-containing protein [Puia sp.]|nr:FG-GAP-like repeat-containing protein [Puia sp.]